MLYLLRRGLRARVTGLALAVLATILGGDAAATTFHDPPRSSAEAATSCGEWNPLFLSSPPFNRGETSAVYDPLRKRMIVVGGLDESSMRLVNQVWALSLTGTPHWMRLTPTGAAPDAFDGNALVYDSTRDRIIVFGGYSNGRYLNDVWAFSLSGAGSPTWTKLVPGGVPPSPRYFPTAIYDATRDRMVCYGGVDDSQRNDTWALEFSPTLEWVALAPAGTLPPARYRQLAIFDAPHDRMVVYGGTDDTHPGSEVWALTFGGNSSWAKWAPDGTTPAARIYHSMVFDAPRDRMLVYGGFDTEHRVVSNELWSLSLGPAPKWTLITPGGTPPAPTQWGSSVYDANLQRLVTFGGVGRPAYEAWTVNLAGKPLWTQLEVEGQPPIPREHASAIYDAPRHRLVLFGGRGSFDSGSDESWAFDLAGGGYARLMPTGTPPAARYDHSAIFDPVRNRMLVFGGASADLDLGDLWSLALSGNPTWTPLHPAGVPPGKREGHTTIYDSANDRMILFGGHDSSVGDLSDVWALALAGGGSWSRLAPTGNPGPHSGHTAVYDPVRQRMLVGGGGGNKLWSLSLSGAGSPAWSDVTPADTDSVAVGHYPSMVYDSAHDRLLSWDELNQIVVLPLGDANAWRRVSMLGEAPDARSGFGLVYDEADDRPVLAWGCCNRNDVLSISTDHVVALTVAASPDEGGSVTVIPDQACFTLGTEVALWAGWRPGFRFAGWGGDASGTDNPLMISMDASMQITARFVPIATPALLSRFEAATRADGVELRWQFSEAAGVRSVAVERATDMAGPWTRIAVEQRQERGVSVALDRSSEADHDYSYRLRATLDGGEALFGPVFVTGEHIAGSGITRLAPNPAAQVVTIDFAVARAGPVRIDVLDVVGRRVATVVEGNYATGRHTTVWDCRSARGRAAAGIYLVRCAAPDLSMVRRLALTR